MTPDAPDASAPSGVAAARPRVVVLVSGRGSNLRAIVADRPPCEIAAVISNRPDATGLALAREHRPDLILMDIQLPEISGLEVTKWLKEDDDLAAIPVVAVTAFAMKGDEERIREGGCEAYISKPISVVHFLETIKRLLG